MNNKGFIQNYHMKDIFKIFGMIMFIISSTFIYSCKKDKPAILVIETASVTDISYTAAVSGGNINDIKGVTIESKGVCWSTSEDPTVDDNKTTNGRGAGNFKSSITRLRPDTEYYLRAYAISDVDTIYGNAVSFTTKNFGKITDIEDNVYRTLTIGSQTWMADNLRTTKLNDGTAIQLVTNGASWAALSTPGYCWYNNDEATFKSRYGALYNWHTVNTGKLCPQGWHVPTDAEWTTLTDYLGGENVAGGKMKEHGTTYWVSPNAGATNESSFTGLPGGFRYHDGEYFDFGFSGYWWSSTGYSDARAYFRFLYHEDRSIFRFNNDKKIGFSVRCLKND
jgi:uncharacterized protein (TIGR02145 family)